MGANTLNCMIMNSYKLDVNMECLTVISLVGSSREHCDVLIMTAKKVQAM